MSIVNLKALTPFESYAFEGYVVATQDFGDREANIVVFLGAASRVLAGEAPNYSVTIGGSEFVGWMDEDSDGDVAFIASNGTYTMCGLTATIEEMAKECDVVEDLFDLMPVIEGCTPLELATAAMQAE